MYLKSLCLRKYSKISLPILHSFKAFKQKQFSRSDKPFFECPVAEWHRPLAKPASAFNCCPCAGSWTLAPKQCPSWPFHGPFEPRTTPTHAGLAAPPTAPPKHSSCSCSCTYGQCIWWKIYRHALHCGICFNSDAPKGHVCLCSSGLVGSERSRWIPLQCAL